MPSTPSTSPPSSASGFRPVLVLPVVIPVVIFTTLLLIGTMSNPQLAGDIFSGLLSRVTANFGWFYMLSVSLFLIFMVGVALSPYGRIKLGPDHAQPQHSFPSWFSMLFSAGYGIALLFFGVAEPVLHYADPPEGADGLTTDAARGAMQIAFFHWGVHVWAIYGLVGLVLAYFSFRHGLPLSMRSALYPLIGERVHGPIGHTVDIVSILATMFGITTTLGLSVAQINAGLNHLWPAIPVNILVQLSCIAIASGLALLSVLAGMEKGIKRLANTNMIIATALMLFVFTFGPTLFILEAFVEGTGTYLNNIIERALNLQAYSSGSDWIGNWTLFVFGWIIAWAPFVGLFIAKISRGRTIRQFIVGVMLVPTLFTFFWFSVFGDTALHLIINEGYSTLIDEVKADNAIALFKLFEHLPFTGIISVITLLLIFLFFVTSADSGALVVNSLASGGAAVSPAWQRAFWVILSGLLASVLLIAGGLEALQSMTVAAALPFAIIMLLAAIGMWRALIIEGHRERSLQYSLRRNLRGGAREGEAHWQKRLAGIVEYPSREDVQQFMQGIALPAMERVAAGLKESNWPARTGCEEDLSRVWLEVSDDKQLNFLYEIRMREYKMPVFARHMNEVEDSQKQDGQVFYYRAELFLRRGGQLCDLYGYDKGELISDLLDHFEKYLHFLHISPGVLPWNMAEHDDMLQDDNNSNGKTSEEGSLPSKT